MADGVQRSLDPRSVQLDRITGWIGAAVISFGLFAGLAILFAVASLSGWVLLLLAVLWVAMTAGLAWWTYRWAEIEHRHTSYKVDARGIEIRRGVLWRAVVNVPRTRVQHTDVRQGPVERSFGLGTLVIYTAGTEHAMVALGGLDHATALRIRDHLLPREQGDAV